MVCLGETGINFAAGMSGGIAYVLDEGDTFARNVNPGMVELEAVETDAEAAELRGFVEMHLERTGSAKAARLLDNWGDALPKFVKVMPSDYKRVLEAQAAAEAGEAAAASA